MRMNKSHRGLRIALSIVLASGVVFAAMNTVAAESSATSNVTIHDIETVYQTADAYGTPRDTVVVDWLRIDGTGTLDVLDPGSVKAAEALEDQLDPTIDGHGVTWSLDVDGRRDFFYRAETDQELPIAVEVEYELDGVSVDASAVAGATGHLRIDVTVTNKLERSVELDYTDANGVLRSRETTYSVPMLVPIIIDVDGTKFSNIEGEAQIVSVTGSTRSHTFMAFPQPEQTISIEMDGVDMEIDPITLSVFPGLASEPDFSVTDGLGELRDGLLGLAQLSSGHYQVLDEMVKGMAEQDFGGMEGASEGFAQLADGMYQLEEGTDGLSQLTQGHIDYLNGLIASLEGQDLDDIAQLPVALQRLTDGTSDLKDGVDGMIALLDGQIQFLDALAASNATLTASAGDMVAAASGDATLTAMATGIQAGLAGQDAMIAALRDGDAGMGLPYGLAYTRAQLQAISDGLGETVLGMQQVTDGAQELTSLPDQFDELAAALKTLRDGGVVYGNQMPGLVTTRDGLTEITYGIGEAGAGVETAADSLTGLEELPAMLGELQATLIALKDGGTLQGVNLPGVSTTIEGLNASADGLSEGIDDAEFGKAVIQSMKDAAAEYDTFLGKPEGATGEVRFIIRLDAITIPDED